MAVYPLRAFKFTHISGNDYKVEWIHLNSDLSVQRTIERSASANLYLTNTDSLTLDHWGNSYYSKWDNDDRRVYKHDNDGEFVWEHFDLVADENTRGLCIAKDGYLLMLKQDVGDTANVRRIPLDKSTSLGAINLTSSKAYFGMALDFSLESEGIYTFYTFNQTDGKIEKRDWLTGNLLAELSVSGEYFGTLTSWDFKLVGNTLMWFTSSTAGMVAMTNKNLEGSVTYKDYITTPDATNISAGRWLASIEDDYFILTANGTYDIPDGEGGFDEVRFSKIWKIDSSGNVISETDKPIDECWQFFDVPQWNGKDEATIQALTPEKTNNDPLTVNFKGNVTDVGVGNGYQRGIEFYDVDKEEGEWGSITYPYDEYETAMTSPQVWRGYPAEEFNFEIYWYVEENKNYKVRAYFDNAYGRTYSEYIDFSTESIEVTTNTATQINYEWAMGNGEITSGTNATERGFEIKVDFVGSIYWFLEYQFAGFEIDGGLSSMPLEWTTNDFGEIGFYHIGEMIKTESEDGDFEEGEFSIILGHEIPGWPGEGEGYLWDRLFPCKTFEYRAYAVIDGETYYGEWVEFSTLCEGSGDNQTGTGDDISDANPTEPIIPISPIVPIEPPFTYPPFVYEPDLSDYPDWDWSYPPWDYDLPEIPPWVDPNYPDLPPLPPWYLPELPEWDIPDYPVPSFVGDFYYKKPYTKKDLGELRKKCIIYNKNSVEFALVLRHNMNVLREFLNMMTDYLGTDEFNDFTDLIPPQNLKELYLDPIDAEGFMTIINGFINNTVNNNMAVNRNFKLLADGLSDYTTSEDADFREITSAMKRIDEDNPDVHRMKQIIDDLNYEVASNFGNVMYNLNVVRARLL